MMQFFLAGIATIGAFFSFSRAPAFALEYPLQTTNTPIALLSLDNAILLSQFSTYEQQGVTGIFVTPTASPTKAPEVTRIPTVAVAPKRFIPSPTPTQKISNKPPSNLEELFSRYSSKESVNKDTLRTIAYCESKLNPGAVNGIYGGMYQFSPGAWTTARKAMNVNTDPELRFDAEEAIKTAAFQLATKGTAAWPNCKK